ERAEVVARGRAFAEDFLAADIDLDAVFHARLRDARRRQDKLGASDVATHISLPALSAPAAGPAIAPTIVEPLGRVDEVFQALVLGTRDYVQKSGFKRIVLGLSGGIDSALVAAIAVAALGRENVVGVTMPSPYSSSGTRNDAQRVAKNLGIEFMKLPITGVFKQFKHTLAEAFK